MSKAVPKKRPSRKLRNSQDHEREKTKAGSEMIKPIVNMERRRLNKTLHGRSVYRKQDVDGHNVFRGYNKPGTGDGIDLFAPVGAPVYAMHLGKITRVMDGRMFEGCYVKGDGITTVYAHLNLAKGVSLNKSVKEGELIGTVAALRDPHLHFECEWKGKALTGETPAGMLLHIMEVINNG